jgi:hypothetical protein
MIEPDVNADQLCNWLLEQDPSLVLNWLYETGSTRSGKEHTRRQKGFTGLDWLRFLRAWHTIRMARLPRLQTWAGLVWRSW